MDTLQPICPNCGKTVTVTEALAEVFCPYCGTKFPVSDVKPAAKTNDAEARNYIESAFRNGEYREMISCADEMLAQDGENAVFLAYKAFGGIFDCIATYRTEAREAYIKHAPKIGLGKFLTGKDAYAEHAVHEQFFKSIEAASTALTQALGALDDGERELRESLSTRAVEKLLAQADPESEKHILFTLCITDQNAVGMLPYLPTGALRDFYVGYALGAKKYRLLPNQEKTAKAMAKELTDRGESLPKESFGDKLKAMFAKNDQFK